MVNVKNIVKEMPDNPGIYIMKNKENIVIYVGKAKNLKKRVSSYFVNTDNKPVKTAKLVENIADIEYIVTDSESEALVLECNFIKRYSPRYNILLRDDKTYPYIKITVKDDFPRVFSTRNIEKDGSIYLGPYPDIEYINGMIDIARRVYKVRRCKNKDVPKNTRPCINYDIGICQAPCMGFISKEEYRDSINKIIKFFEGDHKEVLGMLDAEMNSYTSEYKFEEAAKVRDEIFIIKRLNEKQKVESADLRDQDIIAVAKDPNDEKQLVQIFSIRDGKLIERKQVTFSEPTDTKKEEIMISFLKQYYIENYRVPKEILVEYESGELKEIEEALKSRIRYKVNIYVPKRGKSRRLLLLARQNAEMSLGQMLSKKYMEIETKKEYLKELKETLGLSVIPSRIEAYDISNIQGIENVAAMVVYIDGEKKPSEYRKFKINTVDGPDDVGCMREVFKRRLERLLDNSEKFMDTPDLIIIDGGKNQVEAVKGVAEELGVGLNILGLVKDDKHTTTKMYFNGEEYPLNRRSDLYHFLRRVQDEVHRSAITYFKKVHHKNLIKSSLDDIKGIGERRKVKLLEKYKDIEEIKNASVSELASVPGMNKKVAEMLKKSLMEME